jgi:hypothetical protein
MRKPPVHFVELDPRQIEETLALVKALAPEEAYGVVYCLAEAYQYVLHLLEHKQVSMRRLRQMLFGPTDEKTETLLGRREGNRAVTAALRQIERPKRPRVGHGRNGESAYREARTIEVPHATLQPGARCPCCRKGKVYDQKDKPGILVRLTGQAPLAATIYHLQAMRCNLCGEIFVAQPPEGVGTEKYDASAAVMIALLKYGSGLPFNRLQRLQGGLGIPLPVSTQWEIMRDAARNVAGVHEELVWQGAQGRVMHNDDTKMRILAWMGKRLEAYEKSRPKGSGDGKGEDLQDDRTGIFTSGIVSIVRQHRIALFFTGRRHAGENLNALLEQREPRRGAPIQMCDALSRNVPEHFKTLMANCLTHGRRKFVDVLEIFPQEVLYVLRILKAVYRNDATTQRRRMTARERLKFHQAKSAPLMEKLHDWMERQIAEKRVEPNSSLGEAIAYMLTHWKKLTLFLRRPGAPLDNNVVERALKKAILHRKNALFYKTDNGARVGDLFMSLIYTCELNGADPFDYLTRLLRHAKEAQATPERWMPWNYRKQIPRSRSP